MKTPDANRNDADLPREEDPRCVWMTAGLVAYKLCDHAFECEECPFDAVIRGGLPHDPEGRGKSPAPAESEPLSATAPLDFPDDRSYSSGHAWAKARPDGRLAIGIDALASRLVGRASSVVLPPPGSVVTHDRIGCWIVMEDASPIPIRMPATGPVLRGNARLREEPSLVVESPYDAGWLLEIRAPAPAPRAPGLHRAAEMRARARGELEELHRAAGAALRRGGDAVGATLADGGERLSGLRSMLGGAAYRRLILRYFG
jgi:glycine cleavage system H protein